MRFVLSILILSATTAQAASFPDAHEKPPAGWTGPVFKLSQSYPATAPAPGTLPWKAFDYKTQPEQYIRAVYAYALQGNVATMFRGFDNTVRKWYHAPWMHSGSSGREFIHGMTRERNSRPHELAPTQTCYWQNWAVGLYNAPGGFVIGQVWKVANSPDPKKSTFADGTVSVKLLFTTASVAQVPYLKNGFKWQGNIDPLGAGGCTSADPTGTRKPADLTLLQIDLAVRDTRADATTGWIMGTMVYDGNATGTTPWDRMIPVGVQWGNDPTLTPAKHAAGERVKESWINPALTIPQHLGWLGRLNGPVDNPVSACLSCHGTAQSPVLSPMIPPSGSTDAQKMRWFRNVKTNDAFDAGNPRNPDSLRYSLQLAVGIQNQQRAASEIRADVANGVVMMAMDQGKGEEVFPVSREEGVAPAAETPAAAQPQAAAAAEPTLPAAEKAVSARTPWLAYIGFLVLGIVIGMIIASLRKRPA